jgi:hypothetical protein
MEAAFGVELLNFGLSDAKSHLMPPGGTVPAVSIVMCFPAARSFAANS